jgi:hypothetical protein
VGDSEKRKVNESTLHQRFIDASSTLHQRFINASQRFIDASSTLHRPFIIVDKITFAS